MRYLFRGLVRETGRPVEGHVEASTEDAAFGVLSDNGVVTESLIQDPEPLDLNNELPQSPEFASALNSAFDSSSSQVDFDNLTERYQGKKVWVIDRDKIRRRVAQVVDAALALAAQRSEGHAQTRERVADALQGLFSDNRNLASERNADSISGMKFIGGATAPPPPPPLPPQPIAPRIAPYMPNGGTNGGGSMQGHPGLENQIGRLTSLVKQAEATLAAVAAAARRGGSGGGGGGGGGRRFSSKGGKGEEQNSVLLEIFKSNLELVRGMQEPPPAPAPEGSAEPATEASSGASSGASSDGQELASVAASAPADGE